MQLYVSIMAGRRGNARTAEAAVMWSMQAETLMQGMWRQQSCEHGGQKSQCKSVEAAVHVSMAEE
jgi:hypothetical protein